MKKTSNWKRIINFYGKFLGVANNALDTEKQIGNNKIRTKNGAEMYASGTIGLVIIVLVIITLPIAILVGVWENKFWRYIILFYYSFFIVGESIQYLHLSRGTEQDIVKYLAIMLLISFALVIGKFVIDFFKWRARKRKEKSENNN